MSVLINSQKNLIDNFEEGHNYAKTALAYMQNAANSASAARLTKKLKKDDYFEKVQVCLYGNNPIKRN